MIKCKFIEALRTIANDHRKRTIPIVFRGKKVKPRFHCHGSEVPWQSSVPTKSYSSHKFCRSRIILRLTDRLPEINNTFFFLPCKSEPPRMHDFSHESSSPIQRACPTFLPGNDRRCVVVTHGAVWLSKNVASWNIIVSSLNGTNSSTTSFRFFLGNEKNFWKSSRNILFNNTILFVINLGEGI